MSSPRSAPADRDGQGSGTYARWWWRVWSVVVTVGVGVGILEWSPMTVLVIVAMNTAGVALVLGLLQPPAGSRPAAPGRGWRPFPRRRVGVLSLGAGAGLVALSAVASASPSLALLLALVATLTSPVLVRRLLPPALSGVARVVPPSGPSAAPSPTHPGTASTPSLDRDGLVDVGDLGDLGDDELCLLWRRTFWDLRLVPSGDTVALRARCLDELERRNPAAVQAWLSSGARASSGPERFWRIGHGPDAGTS